MMLTASCLMADLVADSADRWVRALPPVPALRVPSTRAAWDRQRLEIRSTLERLLGDFPERPRIPSVTVLSKEERSGYSLERFTFDNGLGDTVPGVLLLPTGVKGPVPAILYCHWHGGEYRGGKSELFEAKHTPQVPAESLTARGYAVLAVDAPGFGERNGKGPDGTVDGAGEQSWSKYHLWAGRSLWGALLRDDRMALDYLVSRPEVDRARVGVTGISMGATRSWWLMALDDRLKAGVAVACLTRYQDLIEAGGLKYHGIYYFVPGMLRQFDTEAVIALSAPRPLLCLTGDQDSGSPVPGIRRIQEAVAPVWALTGSPAGFQSILYPGLGHVYTADMWLRMLAQFDEALKPGGTRAVPK
jgi:dienelactone hydrolase